jgi:Ca2+-binding EF-hand superfamily protein
MSSEKSPAQHKLSLQELKHLFAKYDKNNDNKIDSKELTHFSNFHHNNE